MSNRNKKTKFKFFNQYKHAADSYKSCYYYRCREERKIIFFFLFFSFFRDDVISWRIGGFIMPCCVVSNGARICWFVFSDAHTPPISRVNMWRNSPHKLHDVDPALILVPSLRINPKKAGIYEKRELFRAMKNDIEESTAQWNNWKRTARKSWDDKISEKRSQKNGEQSWKQENVSSRIRCLTFDESIHVLKLRSDEIY